MAERITCTPTKRYAVVTGANKGIGFETCRQLASHGIMVVLTARDEKRGNEALEKLRGSDLSDHVVFHQLDVVDPSSIASLADFIKTQFGRLDILVNNAGISGVITDWDALKASDVGVGGIVGSWETYADQLVAPELGRILSNTSLDRYFSTVAVYFFRDLQTEKKEDSHTAR